MKKVYLMDGFNHKQNQERKQRRAWRFSVPPAAQLFLHQRLPIIIAL